MYLTKYIPFLISLIFICCSDDSKKIKNDTNELTGILVYFNLTLPKDGVYDSQEDYNNTYDEVQITMLDSDTIFYCYDTRALLKIEILGNLENARIVYSRTGKNDIDIVKNENIISSYIVTPTKLNDYLTGGYLKIYQGDNLIEEIKIIYEGCL